MISWSQQPYLAYCKGLCGGLLSGESTFSLPTRGDAEGEEMCSSFDQCLASPDYTLSHRGCHWRVLLLVCNIVPHNQANLCTRCRRKRVDNPERSDSLIQMLLLEQTELREFSLAPQAPCMWRPALKGFAFSLQISDTCE